ncbi:hypothetical protein L484_007840 [Morus notabilis]|uniref:Uncharacterized protein n=1 Tax=Morus notabilis TaxID=981085 RepID=W9SKW9_9ROSA|nr:hypothetical protein L484_007840 [Morus notabilis]
MESISTMGGQRRATSGRMRRQICPEKRITFSDLELQAEIMWNRFGTRRLVTEDWLKFTSHA